MQLVIDIDEQDYTIIKDIPDYLAKTVYAGAGERGFIAIKNGTPLPKGHERKFEKIIVEYPTVNCYPEYKGKPYFSIQYEENGEHFIGFGTYKPDVLSQYLRECFHSSTSLSMIAE